MVTLTSEDESMIRVLEMHTKTMFYEIHVYNFDYLIKQLKLKRSIFKDIHFFMLFDVGNVLHSTFELDSRSVIMEELKKDNYNCLSYMSPDGEEHLVLIEDEGEG